MLFLPFSSTFLAAKAPNSSGEKLNDVVLYGINWWAATQTTKGNEPVSGSPYWSVVLTALPAVQIPVTSSQPTNQILGDQWYQVI